MVKRIFDIIASLVGLLIASPVILATFLLIRWKLGSPAIFRQLRPGLNGEPFEMVKFRTMLDLLDSEGQERSEIERLTPFGKTLRALSLDELPELWNVLKGDMSLVGPRPLLMEYLAEYTPEQMRRHDVRPGITGWAQINGRNQLEWEEKFDSDLWYVKHKSFWIDLKILILTIVCVFKRSGVNSTEDMTMPKFSGSNKP